LSKVDSVPVVVDASVVRVITVSVAVVDDMVVAVMVLVVEVVDYEQVVVAVGSG
jgi:hypothetical protein